MPIHYSEEYWNTCWARVGNVDSQLKGAILGAGLGRRLDPLTAYHLPKPMFPLGGKVPIAEMWVRRFIGSGITNVSMNLCVLAQAIKRHFGNGAKFGIDLTFVEEEVPSGTLGGVCKMALGRAAKQLPSDPVPSPLPTFAGSTVIVPSGDIVANFEPEHIEEMYEIHRRSGAAFTMILTEISHQRKKDYGTVVLDTQEQQSGIPLSLLGRVRDFLLIDPTAPSCLSNASIYMIETDLLRPIDGCAPDGGKARSWETVIRLGKQVFPALLGKLPYIKLPKDYVLWGVNATGPWFDVPNKHDPVA